MHIKIQVGPTQSIILHANQMILKQIKEVCSYQSVSERQKQYSSACANGWDGKISLCNTFTGTLPTGLVPRVLQFLKEQGHTVELERNLPQTAESSKMQMIKPPDYLRDYQKRAIEQMVRNKRGIVQMPTGSGKTITTSGFIGILKRPIIFFAHTKDLISQTQKVFQDCFPQIKVGTIGDGIIDPGQITVASIQTVSGWLIEPPEPDKPKLITREGVKRFETSTEFQMRHLEWEEKRKDWSDYNKRALDFLKRFPVAVFDECQHLSSDTFYVCAQACLGAEYLIALSATPWREDGADIVIEAGSGKTIYSITMSELIKLNYLLPAEIHIHDYKPLPPMDLSDKYAEQYKICISENDERNEKIIEIVQQENELNRSILVLCREISHIERLSELMEIKNVKHKIAHGQLKERKQNLEDFKTGKNKILIASTILDEGWDSPAIDVVVLGGGGKSRVKSYQRIGRALRIFPGKEKAIIHDFRDHIKPFCYHFKQRLELYTREPAFTVIEHYETVKRRVVHKNLAMQKLTEVEL